MMFITHFCPAKRVGAKFDCQPVYNYTKRMERHGGGKLLLAVVAACFVHVSTAGQSSAEIVGYADENGTMVFSDQDASQFHKKSKKHSAITKEELQGNRRYAAAIYSAGKAYNLDPELIKSVISAESNFNRYAVSRKGAHGLMQLTLPTASMYDVLDVYDPLENINGGAKHLRHLLQKFRGNLKLALAAYNAGENAVLKYSGVPPYPETMEYVKKVMNSYGGAGRIYAYTPKKSVKYYKYENEDGSILITDTPRNLDGTMQVWTAEAP
jgi:hypothetical protein